jgi:hypothetical protein
VKAGLANRPEEYPSGTAYLKKKKNAGLKPWVYWGRLLARLKSCPDASWLVIGVFWRPSGIRKTTHRRSPSPRSQNRDRGHPYLLVGRDRTWTTHQGWGTCPVSIGESPQSRIKPKHRINELIDSL